MSVFDLLFLCCFLMAMASLLRAAYLACRRRWAKAGKLFKRLGYGIVVYGSVLVAVSLTSRPTLLAMGEKMRFDEWCISAERATQMPTIGESAMAIDADGVFWLVTVKVSSEAKRRAQRATDAAVWLIDSQSVRYYPSAEGESVLDAIAGSGPELSTMLAPGGSFERTVVFDVPKDSADLKLGVTHGFFPGVLIIGDAQSFLHAPRLIKLTSSMRDGYLK